MKKINRILPLLLAGLLHVMPLLRSALPAIQNAAGPAWAYVFPWVAGGIAFLSYDAVSSASGISISPSTAINGVYYSGTITYSGGFSGAISSMSVSNSSFGGFYGSCLASGALTLAPGLTVSYAGGNRATLSGTPDLTLTTAYTNLPFRMICYEASGCSTSEEYDGQQTTTLLVEPSGGAQTAPTIASQPRNVVAPIGSTVILSGGAVGNPAPSYFWKQGITLIPGATNNSLTISNVQLTNAGAYFLYASNSVGTTPASAYLSVCLPPGSNYLTAGYTNYYPVGNAVTMYSYVTNVPGAANSFSWDFNKVAVGVTTPNLSLTTAQTTPNKSGEYSVFFTSVVSGSTIVNGAEYDSYWTFGFVPGFTNSPASVSTNTGASVTLTAAVTGTAPSVFWYQNATNLVATQTPAFNPATATANNAATNLSLVLSNVTAANAGTYTVVVTNNWGSITSAPALLTIASTLSVTAPAGQTNYAGNNIGLNVTASGSGTLAYQWLKGSTALASGGTLSGATTTNLAITPAAVGDSGNYSIVVTNLSGSVTSAVAVVSIVPVPGVSVAPSGGNVSLTASGGIANRNYVVETTTNLAAPSWQPLVTNQSSPGGAISFTGTNTPGFNQRYYQLKFP